MRINSALCRLGLLLSGAGALAGVACQTDRDVMNEEEFCVEYAKRECMKVAVACSFAMPGKCEEVRGGICRDWVRRTKTDVRGFRPENAEACLKKVSDTYSEPLIKAEHFRALSDVCNRVFEGTRRALDMCTADADCASGLICDKARCAPRRDVSAGALCANPGDLCPKDEYCKPMAGISMCVKKLSRGGACGEGAPCTDNLRCLTSCADRFALSAPCAQNDDCESGYCSPFTKACATGLNFAMGSPSCQAFEGKTTASASTDGGVDAGALGGGNTDAGASPTGGSDAGVPYMP